MKTSIRDPKNGQTGLAREVEEGKTIVVKRNGCPVFDLVLQKPRGGLKPPQEQGHHEDEIIIVDDFDERSLDRLLLAQCQVEGLQLVTIDRTLAGYPRALKF